MTTELVHAAPNGELTTTSEIIAGGVGIQHKNVLETIRKNQADFEEFGRVAFETRTRQTAGGPQKTNIAVLNREQAMFAMTLFRNTPVVVDFKKNLIKAFVAMEQRLGQAEHQINALMRQSQMQMELCQAAKGLIHPDHLEAKARIVLARGLGEAPELNPATRPLYTADFLKEKNLGTKRMKSVAPMFGKRMKAAYTLEHGEEPQKYDLTLSNGQVRQVNGYTEADRPLMEQVWNQYYAA
ncbi:Rha family transcriptional regulator [Corynebacterium diphtheriae]|uniref:Rha family transcriptional regulator n=1 Tax=Corynebacterium diphtheriae TaxID=1717 RepID=UPI000EF1E668|nr:Rha family transcriptional regulator [Corynebacterium diphtheriae]RLP16713.1 phage antirepressor [Corynebacterium diphtheriae]CAB0973572.1 phage antirepressor [Corynebacterium diphtheriae]